VRYGPGLHALAQRKKNIFASPKYSNGRPARLIVHMKDPGTDTTEGAMLHDDDAIAAVRAAVATWEGVTTHVHRFGGIEFRLGRRELGHLHRSFADLPFPRRVRDELIAAGRARVHHVLPESGWVTAPMRTPREVAVVIELFRQNFERGVNRR
jgi:hypothetical protein